MGIGPSIIIESASPEPSLLGAVQMVSNSVTGTGSQRSTTVIVLVSENPLPDSGGRLKSKPRLLFVLEPAPVPNQEAFGEDGPTPLRRVPFSPPFMMTHYAGSPPEPVSKPTHGEDQLRFVW